MQDGILHKKIGENQPFIVQNAEGPGSVVIILTRDDKKNRHYLPILFLASEIRFLTSSGDKFERWQLI